MIGRHEMFLPGLINPINPFQTREAGYNVPFSQDQFITPKVLEISASFFLNCPKWASFAKKSRL